MTDNNNKQEPVKRTRNASNANASKQPVVRRSVKGSTASKSSSTSQEQSQTFSKPQVGPSKETPGSVKRAEGKTDSPSSSQSSARTERSEGVPAKKEAAAKSSQVAKVARSFKGAVVSKNARTSKIPRTTTASKVGKTGAMPSVPGHRHVAKTKWTTTPRVESARTSEPQVSPSKPKSDQQKPSTTRRYAPASFSKSSNGSQSAHPREKSAPQMRTPSTSNEFIEFTKSHLKIMVPVFILVGLLFCYTCVDIVASFGKIHPGVSVQGVDVGGMTVDEASEKLNEELSPILANARVTAYGTEEMAIADGAQLSESNIEQAYADETAGTDLSGNGAIDKWVITADTIGAYVDGQALADQAYLVGREGNFVAARFFSWFGGTKLEARVAVREERYNALKVEIDNEVGHPIVNSTVSIDNGNVSAVAGSDGSSVETDTFIERFSRSAFSANDLSFIIPMQTDEMFITPPTAEKVAEDVKKAISEDVTIVHDPDTWVMDSADLGNVIGLQVLAPGEALVFETGTQRVAQLSEDEEPDFDTSAWVDADTGYVLQAFVDQTKMDNYLVGILGPLATGGAQDAYFDTSSGEVVLVESVEGFGPDRSAAEIAMQTLLFGKPTSKEAADRTITLVDTTIQPSLTTEMAQSMGITERLATWTIPLSGSSQRISNIRLLCSLINNSLVAPGETWSFNDTTGERTAEKGFQTAPVIINGKHEDQLGGGICQIATCIFNAACFSGLGIAERVNHDFYIASYDDYGFADATVSWKSPDLKWVNDMSTYVLMTAVVTDSDVVVTFWGTKDGRTIDCQRGEWRLGDGYATITEVDPAMAPGDRRVTQAGSNGSSIDIRYLVTALDGTILHDVNFHSIYSAQNEIITVGPAAPAAEPASP